VETPWRHHGSAITTPWSTMTLPGKPMPTP
jgi:hypothetical protein